MVSDRVLVSGDSAERAEVDVRSPSLIVLDLVDASSAVCSSVLCTGALLGHLAVLSECIARVALLNCWLRFELLSRILSLLGLSEMIFWVVTILV